MYKGDVFLRVYNVDGFQKRRLENQTKSALKLNLKCIWNPS